MSAEAAKKIVTYVGRKTDFAGKTLWEIVGSLRNLGVGRLVQRGMFTRYPEPCYFRIVKVETCPAEESEYENQKVRVWVQKTFRGRTLPNLSEIYSTSYKTDYRLIPKNEEHRYLNNTLVHKSEAVLPTTVEMPPLMKESMIVECQRKGMQPPSEFTMPLTYNTSPNRVHKIADRQTRVPPFPNGLGKPASPGLYKGLQLE